MVFDRISWGITEIGLCIEDGKGEWREGGKEGRRHEGLMEEYINIT